MRKLGRLGEVSALTLGGGGLGQLWGPTTREECVATVREAVDAGITLLDLAPSYGDGEAERVIGAAFGGHLPTGVRVTTKCSVGAQPASEVLPLLENSLNASLERMGLKSVDIFFLHSQIVPEDAPDNPRAVPYKLFVEAVRPALEELVARGVIGAWGITGIGVPETILKALVSDPAPAAVQAIANVLDSPGGLKRFEGPARPREIIAAAAGRDIGVMGIRAVQAGALTDAIDREMPQEHPEMVDYRRAAPFRELAREVGESPASLAHRYALSLEHVSTVVLGVKNREELHECIDAEAQGPLDSALMTRVDNAVGRS
ncbi:MAG: aldo/keto reductase [Chloroflexi bacterium]|nr:aldo/keto reductase [Chloroflexota bacterium]